MRILPALAAACIAYGGIIDRVAVVVGNHVITESEVLAEVRLTELMNGQPLDLGPEARKAAADRLVDQQLIRNELELATYPKPTPQEGEAMLRKFREEHFPSVARYRAALQTYGVTEEALKDYLLWQLAVMRFTDVRFHTAAPSATDGASADRAATSGVDDQMDAWLKQQRASTRIQFKKGAFEP
jgi:hypothetical protein